jgi:hypothetical protein
MSDETQRRLLILGCSDRKNDVAPDTPQQLFGFMTTRRSRSFAAWDVYAGVAFQVVKRCQREAAFPHDVDVLILSAKYGLITPDHEITNYDLKMTPEPAARRRGANVHRLKETMAVAHYREVFLMMGRTYLGAIEPLDDWSTGCSVIHKPGAASASCSRA